MVFSLATQFLAATARAYAAPSLCCQGVPCGCCAALKEAEHATKEAAKLSDMCMSCRLSAASNGQTYALPELAAQMLFDSPEQANSFLKLCGSSVAVDDHIVDANPPPEVDPKGVEVNSETCNKLANGTNYVQEWLVSRLKDPLSDNLRGPSADLPPQQTRQLQDLLSSLGLGLGQGNSMPVAVAQPAAAEQAVPAGSGRVWLGAAVQPATAAQGMAGSSRQAWPGAGAQAAAAVQAASGCRELGSTQIAALANTQQIGITQVGLHSASATTARCDEASCYTLPLMLADSTEPHSQPICSLHSLCHGRITDCTNSLHTGQSDFLEAHLGKRQVQVTAQCRPCLQNCRC